MTAESSHIASDSLLKNLQMFLELPIIPSPHSIDLSHSAASDVSGIANYTFASQY